MSNLNLYYMKNLIYLAFLLSLLYGCGTDAVNNPVTNPPTTSDSLVFSVDTLTIFGNTSNFHFQTFQDIDSCSFKNYKAVIQFETNCPDTSGGFQLSLINTSNQSQVYSWYKQGSEANYNSSFTFTFNYTSPAKIRMICAYGFTHQISSNYYVRLKNFKLYATS